MSIKLKKVYFINDGEKSISDLGWEYGKENKKAIVLAKKTENGRFLLACYNKQSEKQVLTLRNVVSYKLTEFGVIICIDICQKDKSNQLRWGFATFDGKITIQFNYSEIKECDLHKNYFYVKDKYTGIYDYLGNEILKTEFTWFEEHDNCIVYGNQKSEKELLRKGIYFVNTGKIVLPKYINVEVNKMCVIVNNIIKNYGAFKPNGEVLLKDDLDAIMLEEMEGKYLLRTCKKVKSHIVNGLYSLPDGKCIIPLKNSFIQCQLYGVETIDVDTGLCELYTYDGNKVLPVKYGIMYTMGYGKILTKTGDNYSIYTCDGKLVHSGKYKSVNKCVENATDFYQIKLYNVETTFLYIPCINTIVPGCRAYEYDGKIEYFGEKGEIKEISESMYDNAYDIKNLYEYKLD